MTENPAKQTSTAPRASCGFRFKAAPRPFLESFVRPALLLPPNFYSRSSSSSTASPPSRPPPSTRSISSTLRYRVPDTSPRPIASHGRPPCSFPSADTSRCVEEPAGSAIRKELSPPRVYFPPTFGPLQRIKVLRSTLLFNNITLSLTQPQVRRASTRLPSSIIVASVVEVELEAIAPSQSQHRPRNRGVVTDAREIFPSVRIPRYCIFLFAFQTAAKRRVEE